MTTVCSRGVGMLAASCAAEGTKDGFPCPLWSAAPTFLTATAAAAEAAVPETNVRRDRFRSVVMRCSLAHEPPLSRAPTLARERRSKHVSDRERYLICVAAPVAALTKDNDR